MHADEPTAISGQPVGRMAEAFVENLNTPAQHADELWDRLSDDVEVHVIGATALSGNYYGRAQIEKVLLGNWNALVRDIRFELVETVAGDGSAAMLLRASGHTHKGRVINESRSLMGLVLDFQGEKISRLRVHPDTREIEETICGNRYVPRDRAESGKD